MKRTEKLHSPAKAVASFFSSRFPARPARIGRAAGSRALALGLTLIAATAATAQHQENEVLARNTGQVVAGADRRHDPAQASTTGSNAGGGEAGFTFRVVDSFGAAAASPNTEEIDVGWPFPTGATTEGEDGGAIAITFSKALAPMADPQPIWAGLIHAFTVRGTSVGIDSDQHPSWVTVSGQTVTLHLGTPVLAGQKPRVSYRPGATEDRLRAPGGDEVREFLDLPVTNLLGTAPALKRAEVFARADGQTSTLRLTFDMDLDPTSAPAGAAFEVRTSAPDDSLRTIMGFGAARILGSQVDVELAAAVRDNELASVRYARPDVNPLRGKHGGNVAEISNQKAAVIDERPPVLLSDSVAGSVVTLYYSETLDAGSAPPAEDFAAVVAGAEREVSAVRIEGSAVVLRLASAATADQTVTLSYAAGADPIRDAAGNAAADISDRVLNNEGPADGGAPTLVTKTTDQDPAVADEAQVTLTFNQSLDPASVPGVGAFTLPPWFTGAHAVSVEGASVVLRLIAPVYPCDGSTADPITVSYAPDGNPLRNHHGAEVAAFADQPVTNARSNRCAVWLAGHRSVQHVRVERTELAIGLSRQLARRSEAAGEHFTVRATASGGPPRTIAGAGPARIAGSTVMVTLTSPVEPVEGVTVSYERPAGAVGLWDEDGNQLEDFTNASVTNDTPGNEPPVGISVADARVEENEGAVLAFAVTLSRSATRAVSVDYATSDGSAQAGVDYVPASGTLRFEPGESSATIEVGVLDDSVDEGEETLTLRLSNATPGRLVDGEATGTIKNRDPLPRALLARFGRTAAVHVVEQVEERLAAPREPGLEGGLAGLELRSGMEREFAQRFLNGLGGPGGGTAGGGVSGGVFRGILAAEARPPDPLEGPGGGELFAGGLQTLGLGGENLLTGADFALNGARYGGILSLWSRGAQSRFSGQEDALSLGGEMRTTTFGADYARGRLTAGMSLSHSRGLGEYAGASAGRVASAVTGLYPWLGYEVTERVTVWGVAGRGKGGLLLTPETGPTLESGLSLAMAAAGTRGELLAGGAGGLGLAFKADALWVGTSIEGVDGPGGRLQATDAAVTRFRTRLEGSRSYLLADRLSLKPLVEVGLRHDGGDAETGAGLDVGGGLVASDAVTGLSLDLRARMLLVHQAAGFSERGLAVSLSYDPTPASPLGLTAKLAPSWGGQATSAAEALWGPDTLVGLTPGGIAPGSRVEGALSYGLPVGRRLVGTPRVVFSTSEQGRGYGFGYGLGLLDTERLRFELGLDAHRRESALQGGPDQGLQVQATLGW